jgi:hypothetical protein
MIGRDIAYAGVAIVALGFVAVVVGFLIGSSHLAATGAIVGALSAGALGAWFCGVFMSDAGRERASGITRRP